MQFENSYCFPRGENKEFSLEVSDGEKKTMGEIIYKTSIKKFKSCNKIFIFALFMPENPRILKRATETDLGQNRFTLTGTDKRGGRKLHWITQHRGCERGTTCGRQEEPQDFKLVSRATPVWPVLLHL